MIEGMGTKIQSNRYVSGYCSIWGLNETVNNDVLSLYQDGKAPRNGQHYDPVLPQKLRIGGSFQYDKEKVRQMILEHESTFRHQLQELHRLYGRQREIMNEFKRREVKNGQMESETCRSSSFPLHITSSDSKPGWHVSHTSLLHSLLDQASASQNSSLPSVSKGNTMLVPLHSRDGEHSEACEPPNVNNKLLSRRVFDLEMPAKVHMNDEYKIPEKGFSGLPGIESSSATKIDQSLCNKDINHRQNGDALWSNSCIRKNNQLADLNEPVPHEENSASVIVGNSGGIASTSTDIGWDQLRIGHGSRIYSNGAGTSTRDACSKTPEVTADQGMTKRQIRRRLFGVDIFEVDDGQVVTDLSMVNCDTTSEKRAEDLLPRLFKEEAPPKSFENSAYLKWKSDDFFKTANNLSNITQDVVSEANSANADFHKKQNEPKASLLCYGQPNRTNKNPHHLNLDSLQHSCQLFFQKSKTTTLSSQKQEETEQWNNDGGNNSEITNCFSVSNFKEPSFAGISSKDIYVGSDGNNSGQILTEKAMPKFEPRAGDTAVGDRIKNSRPGFHQLIDLNSSLTEDEAPSVPFPSAVVEIARTEIDLQAPMALQSEADTESNSLRGELKGPNDEELQNTAAEAIVSISSSTLNVAPPQPLEAVGSDHLSWFAELACLYKWDDWNNASELTLDGVLTEDMIPEGIDYFEFMTLRLKDTKENNYYHSPQITENVNELGEETIVPTESRRPRRGQARKGRQRKDFQRDILPALITLSKHEVIEDFQTLEELFKSSGCEWESSLRRKAGGKSTRRKKSSNLGVSTPPRETDAIPYPALAEQPVSTEGQVEEKTLSGWGKRTRRLPRQRYTNGCHTSQLQP